MPRTIDKKKIKLALNLYPVYEALSDDLFLFTIIEMLFLTLVKGFSDSQIALILMIVEFAVLIFEYPSYKLIEKIGNSKSTVIGAVMPVIAIVLITLGKGVPSVVLGHIFYSSAINFQSMASASTKNNLLLYGERDLYTKLFSRGSMIYSGMSMVATLVIPILFSFNRYLPSLLCFITYALLVGLSFMMPDYSERVYSAETRANAKAGANAKAKERKRITPSPIMRSVATVFCVYFCAIVIFCDNSELIMSNNLSAMFTEHKTILVYGAIMWVTRVIRFLINTALPKIMDRLKDKIVLAGSFILFAAFALTGLAGLLLRNSIPGIVIMGASYILIRGIVWDPMRVLLRLKAVDTNSKKKRQFMLVLINLGQSVTRLIMRVIVCVTLKIAALDFVFLVFAVIMLAEMVIAYRLSKLLKDEYEVLSTEFPLTADDIDHTSQTILDILEQNDIERKQALTYRLLVEERLFELLKSGHEGENARMTLIKKQDEFDVKLSVGDTQVDVFSVPESNDSASSGIYSSLMGSLDD